MRSTLLVVGSFVLVFGVRTARADFPSLPQIKNIALGVSSDTGIGKSDLDLGDNAVKGVQIEVGLLLREWPARTHEGGDPNKPLEPIQFPDTSLVFYSGISANSLTGTLTSNIHADSLLKETYFGVNVQYRWSHVVGAFLGGDVRFTSFDSGRAYADDANRTAYKISGNGYGGEGELGFTFLEVIYVQAEIAARRWPSIVVDPPSGTMLPSTVPEKIWLETVGVSVGVMFTFDAAGGGGYPKVMDVVD